MRPARPIKHGRFFYSKAKDCARCPLKGDCLSKGRVKKAVVIGDDYPALLRARRRREQWSAEDRRLYTPQVVGAYVKEFDDRIIGFMASP